MYVLDLYSFLLGVVTGIAGVAVLVGFAAALFAFAGADSPKRGLSGRPPSVDWIAHHRDLVGLGSTAAAAEHPQFSPSAPRPRRPPTPSPRVRGKS